MTTITRSPITDRRPEPRPDYPAPRYRRFLGAQRSTFIYWAVIIVLAALVLAPVVPTLYQSLRDRPLYESGESSPPPTTRSCSPTPGSEKSSSTRHCSRS